jgi:hypothetical protein
MGLSLPLRTVLSLALLCTACSERVVDGREYDAEGKLEWETVMPSSRNTALWLRYSLSSSVKRASAEDEGIIIYDLSGQLSVVGDGISVYNGGILLTPEGPTVDKTYSKGVRDGIVRSCGYSTCQESGRLMLLSLAEVSAGTRLNIESWLPSEREGSELLSAKLELAPH